jgi:hypothetical protein
VDGADGLHICRVAANILNKLLWTASNEQMVLWLGGLGEGLTTLDHKKSLKYYAGAQTLWALMNTVLPLGST